MTNNRKACAGSVSTPFCPKKERALSESPNLVLKARTTCFADEVAWISSPSYHFWFLADESPLLIILLTSLKGLLIYTSQRALKRSQDQFFHVPDGETEVWEAKMICPSNTATLRQNQRRVCSCPSPAVDLPGAAALEYRVWWESSLWQGSCWVIEYVHSVFNHCPPVLLLNHTRGPPGKQEVLAGRWQSTTVMWPLWYLESLYVLDALIWSFLQGEKVGLII